MKHRIMPRWLLAGLMVALAIAAIFSQVDPSAARPPQQGGGQPDFSVSIQTSPDGSATVESSETRLDSVYFAANGSLEGLTIAPAGLVLDEGQPSGVYTSGVIVSPLAVTTDIAPLWQADLPPGAELRLETRLSLDNGESWSDWIENPEAYYPVRENLRAGNLIWVGSDRAALQFRVNLAASAGQSPTLRSLTLVFNDTSRGPADGDIAALMAPVRAAQEPGVCPLEKPAVVSRTGWGCPDGQFSPRRPPTYAPVTHVIIHQAETPNSTSPYLDWAGWVRSVWHYHANVLWWGDVGYNYIIDPEGTIYEGRAGGEDVIGIHDTINHGSMAIGFLGCYGNCDDPRLSVAEPSQAMLDSAAALVAWKLDQQDIDPLSSGPYGPLSDVPVVAGGRDVTATTSPGDNLYDRLPELRAAAAEAIEQCLQPLACQVADVIFDKEEYLVNDIINMTLKLVDSGGQPLGGAVVTGTVEPPAVTASQADEFDLIDRTGDYDGSYSQTTTPGEYLFTFTATDPTGTRFAPCSAQATVLVKSGGSVITPCQLALSLDRAQYQVGETINFSATVTNGPGAVVTATIAGPDKPVFGPFNLAGAGPYTGSYTDTTPAGSYLVTATATDPTGQNFLACSAQTTAQVLASQPGVVVRVVPAALTMSQCVVSQTSTIAIENVSELRAIDLDIRFDPAVVQVVDADPGEAGVQVRPLGPFGSSSAFVAVHQVDNEAGRIQFVATLVGSGLVNGNAGLIAIDWEPVEPGTSQIQVEKALLAGNDGQPISTGVEHGAITVTPGCQGPIVGVILLQGRNNNGGVVVKNEEGQQALTAADGSFSIGGSGQFSASFPGYLSAQASVDSSLAAGPAGLNLGRITLPAGDVNGDDVINIFDLAYLANRYQSHDTAGDLNADGVVNILDLALAAGNYQQQGPLVNWK